MTATPASQRAVQLTGPDQLRLNEEKDVLHPGPHQILCRVEVCGLCFSDLKLLKQFQGHVRKSEVVAGIDAAVLREVPNYVPGEKATVPGHETVVRVVEVGPEVSGIREGDRFLVQADYRWLKTANSNAAFGYNFEGGLQEFILFDQRVVTAPDGESMLLPAREDLPASAVALVEPWACVEDSYVVRERQRPRPSGRALVVGDHPNAVAWAREHLDLRTVNWLSADPVDGLPVCHVTDPAELPDEYFDDIVFFGGDAGLLEQVFPKLAKGGLINLVQAGARFGRPVSTPVGKIHYGNQRVTGTPDDDPEAGYARIPATGEIREGDRINVIGAGGPMGTMHVIRNLCQGVPGVEVLGGDLSDERLAALTALAGPLAEANGLTFTAYNPKTSPPAGPFDYIATMAPVPPLVAQAVLDAAEGGIINIFAGIPAGVDHPMDLDTYVARGLYFIGTSGSDLNDMKIVLNKVQTGSLDTNLSVAAVSGLDGAVDGIRAVEKQAIPGKIIVYPSCRGLPLTPLETLGERHPEVAARLDQGRYWTPEAEAKLIALYAD